MSVVDNPNVADKSIDFYTTDQTQLQKTPM